MTKLSDRFKKTIEKYEEQPIKIANDSDKLRNKLLEKVNSVPCWHDYSPEKQRELVYFFVKNSDAEDKETLCETLTSYVTGFGALQKFLDNKNVSAVFVKNDNSVHIEIGGNVFDTEMILSQNMLRYVLNFVESLKFNGYETELARLSENCVNLTIRKK